MLQRDLEGQKREFRPVTTCKQEEEQHLNKERDIFPCYQDAKWATLPLVALVPIEQTTSGEGSKLWRKHVLVFMTASPSRSFCGKAVSFNGSMHQWMLPSRSWCRHSAPKLSSLEKSHHSIFQHCNASSSTVANNFSLTTCVLLRTKQYIQCSTGLIGRCVGAL